MRPHPGGCVRRVVRVTLGAGLALGCLSTRGVAQEPHGLEAGLELSTTLASPVFAGAGLSVGIRPGGGTRIVATAMPGVERRRLAGRGELLGQFMLMPARVRGVGFYGLAGVAGQVGRRDAGWLVLGLGMEGAPGGRSGWHLEAGIGGGMRIAVGWRWRWLRAGGSELP
jgi:hypothetical protein